MKTDKLNKFSVPLGLLDYVNPILYSITMIIIIKNTYQNLEMPFNIILLVGAVISIIFGLVIPTGKVIVGLGIIEFKMPVSLVFSVNTGIFLSGLMLLKYTVSLNILILLVLIVLLIFLLYMMYKKSKKVNTIAVLTGALGYLMIYISLIILSIRKTLIIPVVLYCLAILLFVTLCGIGIKANLKNPKMHWVIEISNVTCQFLVALGTTILFVI